jgi:hypothetical protein
MEAIDQRRRLDEALGNLTLLEIGFETGQLAEEKNRDNAWQRAGLTGFERLVTESESFFGYCSAYLYFGARILAYRCFGACWPPRQLTSDKNDGSTNRRSFPSPCLRGWYWLPQATWKRGMRCSPILSKYGETNGGIRRRCFSTLEVG